MLMGFLEIACQKNIQRLITERDRCVDAHQIFQMVTTVARLLLQLAVRAVNLRLIRRIQLTSRNLQCIAVSVLEEYGLRNAVIKACDACYEKCIDLK